MSDIAKSSFIVTALTALGVGLGLLSNLVIAAKFGSGKDMDIFFAATTIPLFISGILADALRFTFIPVFAEYREKEPSDIWNVFSSLLNLTVIVTAGLCLTGILFANTISNAVTPGFSVAHLERSSELLRWLFPMLVLTLINELMANLYYCNKRFTIPSSIRLITPIITIGCVLLFHNSLSTKSIVIAMLAAAFVQTVLLCLGFSKTRDFSYSFAFLFKHPMVTKMLHMMTPLVLGMIVYRAVPIIDRHFLSELSEGSVSHIGYATNLISVLQMIIVSGISISIFPVMSRYAVEKEWDSLRTVMSRGIRMFFFLTIPFVTILGPYSRPLIKLILERGSFAPSDTGAVYFSFLIYLLALPAMAIGTIIGQGYYVLQDTKTPTIVGIIEIVVYVGLCIILLPQFDYLAIPISYALYLNIALLCNALIVRHRLGSRGGRGIVLSIGKHLIVALIPLCLLTISSGLLTSDAITIYMVILSFGLYLILCRFILRTEESLTIWNLIQTFRLSQYNLHSNGKQ